MDEHISRAGIIAEYDRQHQGPPGGARKIMETFPAADVRPVVHGKWEEEDSASNRWAFRCSICSGGPVGRKFNFCPNCGADMRQTSDENI